MNEQIQEYLLSTMERLDKGLSSGVDFLAGEIPLYIQELLVWYAVKSAILAIISVLVLITLTVVWIKYSGKGEPLEENPRKRKMTLTHDEDGDIGGHVIILAPISIIIAVVAMVEMFNLDWLQIALAPRVWLLEYMSELVK